MADISIEMLILMFITVLLASLIGGFITVRFGSTFFSQHPSNTTQSHNRARISTINRGTSLTPQVSLNNHTTTTNQQLLPLQNATTSQNNPIQSQPPIASLSNINNPNSITQLNSQSNAQPQGYGQNTQSNAQPQIYGQITQYPTQMTTQPNIFQYPNPNPNYINNMNNLVNQTINNGNFPIPPAPSQPPTSTINTPQKRVTGLLNEQYQPKKGNITDLKTNRMDNNNNNMQQLITPNTQKQTQIFGSSHALAFDKFEGEILKFPPRSSQRVTDSVNITELKREDDIDEYITRSPGPTTPIINNTIGVDNDSHAGGGGGISNGQKMNFFNLPPIKTKDEHIQRRKSFPDDLSPSSLLTPPSSPPSVASSTNSGQYVGNGKRDKNILKIIIVCYKLPLKCTYNKDTTEWDIQWEDIRNVLANLRVLQSSSPSEYEINFVGWPGVTPPTLEEQDNLEDQLYSLKYGCYPIFLSDSQIKNCYKTYCRSILWPLFHYLMPTNDYQFGNNYEKYWQSYVGLNNLYAKKACVAATDNDKFEYDNKYDTNNDSNYDCKDFIIWFHDYHLLLAPHFVRRQIPLAQIGLFVHTTFPTSEVFRCLPTRREILRGILSSDLVGFHTYDYARHFLSACKRILDLDFHTLPDDGTLAIHYLGRDVSLRIGHASILSHDIHKKAQSQRVKLIRQKFWKPKLNMLAENNKKKIILGLGELDEVRGTILTIQAFHRFLLSHPEWQNDIIFILCISTNNLEYNTDNKLLNVIQRSQSYGNLRRPIEDEINKMKLQFNTDVIQLIDSNNLKYGQLLALYTLCDVAVFGTFWDGFNTVPYEFTAAQPSYNIMQTPYPSYSGCNDLDIDDERGVPPAVILSEFMGCMRSLCGVFRINPWKISEVSSTLHTALCMTSKERRVAHHRRFSHVMKYTLIDWSVGFINDLKKAAKSERNKRVLPIGFGSNLRFIYIPNDLTNLKQYQKLLITSFKSCKYKILLIDYGGTLTDVDEMNRISESDKDDEKTNNNRDKVDSYRDLLGITKDLETISPKIIRNLQILSSDPNTIVAIVSGQTRENLEKAFALCPGLLICAEKGAWFRYPGETNWAKNPILKQTENDILIWKKLVLDVLKIYTERTNGSYIQKKSTALVWHYVNTDPDYGDMQATEVERYLRRIIDKHHNLVVQRYDHCRALEVLPKEIHKGSASLKIIDEMLKKIDYNGDDSTGNNTFILSIGNDRSDEKMFEAVELASKEINTEYGFTVRIGMVPTQARFYLTDQSQMLWLLNTLSSSQLQLQQLQESPQQYFKPSPDNINMNNNMNNMNNIPKPQQMKSRRSHSYSSGLNTLQNDNNNNNNNSQNNNNINQNNNNNFRPLYQIQRSIDQLPIPPTAPNNPISTNINNKIHINNQTLINYDLVSPEFHGSFFDNVAVRSHSYTCLAKLDKLTELNEPQISCGSSTQNLLNVENDNNQSNNGNKLIKTRTS